MASTFLIFWSFPLSNIWREMRLPWSWTISATSRTLVVGCANWSLMGTTSLVLIILLLGFIVHLVKFLNINKHSNWHENGCNWSCYYTKCNVYLTETLLILTDAQQNASACAFYSEPPALLTQFLVASKTRATPPPAWPCYIEFFVWCISYSKTQSM